MAAEDSPAPSKAAGKALIEHRLRWCGMTKTELAGQLGVSRSVLSRKLAERYPDTFSDREVTVLADRLDLKTEHRAFLRHCYGHDGLPAPGAPGQAHHRSAATPDPQSAEPRPAASPSAREPDLPIATPTQSGRPNLPAGTVTLLFTDIEQSTALLRRLGDRYPTVLAAHHALLRQVFGGHSGVEVDSQGDAFFYAFPRASQAVAAAAAAQQALAVHLWPEGGTVRVRMGLHTGEPHHTAEGYVGLDVHRAARLGAAGHGGQVVLSQTTVQVVGHDLPAGVTLHDLGTYALKDLVEPEHLMQLVIAGLPAAFPPLRAPASRPRTNLPAPLSRLVGRTDERVQVQAALQATRLLTLTGAGGVGKTRLALAVGQALVPHYPDGVWLVDLATLTDPALVTHAVAAALNVREAAGQPLTATLLAALQGQQALLLLDNCEHLVAACAEVVGRLLHGCPRLTVLATSRQALGLTGETVYRVPSLAFPAPAAAVRLSAAQLGGYAAVQLFVDRAQSVQSAFALTASNAPAVQEICQRLEGIPLAVELAAARVRMLSVEQITGRLDHQFRLLTDGERTALPRHRTLQAAIDWSYELLAEPERALFDRLSVFAGGFTLEAAEAVCGEPGPRGCARPPPDAPLARPLRTTSLPIAADDVLDVLTQLTDKSLVVIDAHGPQPRYRVLEPLRQYGWVNLKVAQETEVLRRRHLAWCLALAEQAEPALQGPDQGRWLDRLETEHDNLRAALAGAALPGESDAGLQLARALWHFWSVRGYLSEGRHWLTRALTEAPPAPAAVRAGALNGAGRLALEQGDFPAARTLLDESLALSRASGDRPGMARALSNLGEVARRQGDYAVGTQCYEESGHLWQALGDGQGLATTRTGLGVIRYYQGAYAAARTLHEESLRLGRAISDQRGIANSLNNLALVVQHQGDYATARVFYTESLTVRRQLADRPGITTTLNNLGTLAWAEQDYSAARALFEESLALRREFGDQAGMALTLGNLGLIAHYQGDHGAARELYTESLARRRALGDRRGVAVTLGHLAETLLALGDSSAADALYRESLMIGQELGETQLVAQGCEGLAGVAAAAGRLVRAARLLGTAETLREQAGVPLTPAERTGYDRTIAVVQAGLEGAALAAAWATGRSATREQAVAFARMTGDGSTATLA